MILTVDSLRVNMKRINKKLVENFIFSDNPINWLSHAKGFHYSGLKLIEALPAQSKTFLSTKDIFFDKYAYKVGVYLLSHAIELLLKFWISKYNFDLSRQQPCDFRVLSNRPSDEKILKDWKNNAYIILDKNPKELYYVKIDRDSKIVTFEKIEKNLNNIISSIDLYKKVSKTSEKCQTLTLFYLQKISSFTGHIQDNFLGAAKKYSHDVVKMANDLKRVGVITLSANEESTFRLVKEFLEWFGRYYEPKNIEDTIEKSFSAPDKEKMISFKYDIDAETYKKLDAIYKAFEPQSEIPERGYLLNTP